MSVLEWKQINTMKLIAAAQLNNKLQSINCEIVASCGNATQRIFCDLLGNVYIFFKNWDCIFFATGNESIRLCTVTRDGLLIILNQDKNTCNVVLQIYNLQKLTKRNGAPLSAVARLSAFSMATVIHADHYDNICIIGIGFEKGDLQLHYASLNRDISSGFRTILIGIRPVTGIQFSSATAITSRRKMFVSTSDAVYCFDLHGYGSDSNTSAIVETKVVLDSLVKTSQIFQQCTTLHFTCDCENAYFVVGRDDAIYCFTSDGRGPCYALDGQKSFIAWFGNNLIVAIQPKQTSFTSNPSTEIFVVDIQNKIIVLNQMIDDQIECIFEQDETCVIVTKKTREIYLLQDRNIESKIQLLIKKHMYDLALRLLEKDNIVSINNNSGHSDLAAYVNWHYGNHLFQKGNYSAAVTKYIKTIGVIKPFDVIQKLLNSRHNNCLVDYLESLVKSTYSTEEHKKLLLNCQDRLKLPFDVDIDCFGYTNIKSVSQNCNWAYHAPFNNKLFCKSLLTLDKIFEDNATLLQMLECETEQTIFNIFSQLNVKALSVKDANRLSEIISFIMEQDKLQRPEKFIGLFTLNDELNGNFLQYLVKHGTQNQNRHIYNRLFEHYLHMWQKNKISETKLVEYIRNNKKHVHLENALINCKINGFQNGVEEILSFSNQHNTVLSQSAEEDTLYRHIQAINREGKQRKNYMVKTSKINFLMGPWLQKNSHYLLQTLQNISNNKNIPMSYVKDFFMDKNFQKVINIETQKNIISSLSEKIKYIKTLLHNFNKNPIEYRNNICDICRQELRLPSVFFLCQHCFHKDCFNAYTTNQDLCVTCNSANKTRLLQQPLSASSQKINRPENIAILNVCTMLTEGLFSLPSIHDGRALELLSSYNLSEASDSTAPLTKRISSSKQKKVSNNPFDDENTNPFEEYDNNLNPFG